MPEPAKTADKPVTSMGLPKNTASALCYATGFLPYAGWLTGLLFLFFAKDKDVRFHALQSLALFGGIAVAQIVLSGTVILAPLGSLIYVGQFIVWLMLIYKTYHGQKWVLPYVGQWVEKQIK